MANFTPQEIEDMLREFFDVVGKRQYVGARYVPIFGRKDETSILWDNSKPYEPLTIVLYQGNSYTSRQYVPIGVELDNDTYWALTGNYNAQVEQYRQDVLNFSDSIVEKAFAFDTVSDMKESDSLYVGAICRTNGFREIGDGGGAWYSISNDGTVNGMDVIACGNLFAHLILSSIVSPEMFGAYGDGTTNDTTYFNRMFDVVASKAHYAENDDGGTSEHKYYAVPTVALSNKDYVISSTYNGNKLVIEGNGAIITSAGNSPALTIGSRNVFISNLMFANCKVGIKNEAINQDQSISKYNGVIFVNCDTGLYLDNQSSHIEVNKCLFARCKHPFEQVNCDYLCFTETWFEAYDAMDEGAPYFHATITSHEVTFYACSFIPSGNNLHDNSSTPHENEYWFHVEDGTSIKIHDCRFSAERGYFSLAYVENARQIIVTDCNSINFNKHVLFLHGVPREIVLENCICTIDNCVAMQTNLSISDFVNADFEQTKRYARVQPIYKIDCVCDVDYKVNANALGFYQISEPLRPFTKIPNDVYYQYESDTISNWYLGKTRLAATPVCLSKMIEVSYRNENYAGSITRVFILSLGVTRIEGSWYGKIFATEISHTEITDLTPALDNIDFLLNGAAAVPVETESGTTTDLYLSFTIPHAHQSTNTLIKVMDV